LTALGFQAADLTGEYFAAANFSINNYDASGNAQVDVTAPAGLTGSGVLANDGTGWVYTP
jgi:hypothetical protein